jgi:osmoprotectant transport system ATP-binding protein
VIQEVGLFPHFTVAENVGLVPELLGWDAERVSERVDELLALVGLEPGRFADRYPRQLSGGQAQRVGVARALAGEPGILLCDEPFGALDPITRHALQREFRALSRRLRKSLLFVTHDVREAVFLGDRIALLEEGALRFLGSPEALRSARDPGVRVFLDAAELPGG